MVFRLLEPVSLKHDNPADRPTQTPCHSFFSLASVGIRSPDPGGFSLNSEVMAPPPSLYACAGCTRSLTEVTLPRFRFVCQELPSRLWQSWSQLLNFLKFSVSRWFAKEPRENSARNVTRFRKAFFNIFSFFSKSGPASKARRSFGRVWGIKHLRFCQKGIQEK